MRSLFYVISFVVLPTIMGTDFNSSYETWEHESYENGTLDVRHLLGYDHHGRELATHFKFSPAELESEMVCKVKPWDEATSLPGWCGPRYPAKYKPCPQCFIDNWCSPRTPWFGITCNGGMMTGRVIRIEFEGKQIGGEIYTLMPFFTALQKIGLLSNGLSGGIPGNIGGCKALTHMSLDKNELTGAIPGSLGGAKALTYLNFGNNQLSGRIPGGLGGLSNIRYLYFNNNQLNGAIPAALGSLRKVSYMTFATNALTGQVPATFCSLQLTTVIDIVGNEGLTCYPQCLAKYSSLVRDNDSRKGKVLCCCSGCSKVEVTENERHHCPPTWPTAAPWSPPSTPAEPVPGTEPTEEPPGEEPPELENIVTRNSHPL